MASGSKWDELNRLFAIDIVSKLRQKGFIAYFAGGCVRDQLMGRTPTDYDVATDASPDQVVQIFGSRHTLLVGAAFGVACVHKRIEGQGFQVEVATFRSDGEYVDGRRPSSVRYASPQDDAQRRDFTINGMFFDPLEDQLIDYVGGQDDLRDGVLRAIGDAASRISEDKLRMVRAIRFAARFGFKLDSKTQAAIVAAADQLAMISRERLADELNKICRHGSASDAIDRLHIFGLMDTIWPRLAKSWTACTETKSKSLKVLQALCPSDISTFLAVGIWGIGDSESQPVGEGVQEIAEYLKLSNEVRLDAEYLAQNIGLVLDSYQKPWSQVQPIAIHPRINDLLALATSVANIEQAASEGINALKARLQQPIEELNPSPLLNGDDLIRMGYRPGTQFKSILQTVRNHQLDQLLHSQAEAANFVKQHYPPASP